MRATTREIAIVVALFALGCQTSATGETGANTLVGKPRPDAAQLSRSTIWYRVVVAKDSLDVSLRLFAPPDSTRFFLPTRWAGEDDFAAAIGITGARGPHGPLSFALSRERGEVEVASRDLPWVELHYRVDLADRSPFHPQFVDGAVLAYGVTFLVTPGQQYLERTRAIPVEVVTPPGWTAVSTWPLADRFASAVADGSTVYAYVAEDAAQLREAFLVAGPAIETARRAEGDALVEVAFGSAFGGDRERFADFVTSVTRQYGSRYGAAGPVHVYVSSGATTSEELTGIGRQNGFVVNVPADHPLSESARLLVAHEALHLWNGHRLVPRPDAEVATRWFKEGLTHYLALKMLARTGSASEKFVLSELARSAASYARNPVSRGAAGSELDQARFPYDFGFLVAHAADAALHTQSGGELSGEDWLAAMLSRSEKPYVEQDLLVALQSLSGGQEGISEAERVWRRYVRVREPFDLAKLFALVGLHWLPETSERPGRLVPLARQPALFRQLFELPPSGDSSGAAR